MRILVAYATRHGATAGIAERIAATLQANGLAAEARPVGEVDDVGAYDAVVLGGAAYLFHWLNDATSFAKRHRAGLAERPVWLFSSGPLGTDKVDKQGRDVLEVARPKEFAKLTELLKPRGEQIFFGAWDPAAAPIGFGERMLKHLPVSKNTMPPGDFRDWEAIDDWATQIAALSPNPRPAASSSRATRVTASTTSNGALDMSNSRTSYSVRVDASVQPASSRGLWLVKWLLLIPHAIVLSLLWIGFVVVSVIAFFAILITARYPRALFDFNVGVLRWTWRVHYYGYGALGTDQYPPFTLADVPDYPARLDVDYPQHLSRGLVLVKWWLLAIPHYLIVALFVGGGIWIGPWGPWGDRGNEFWGWGAGGLVALLVLIAGVVLLFSGRYPQSLYDFILGMDRWALRVAGYAALMTDDYPPFRMDMGGPDPSSAPTAPTAPPPFGVAGGADRGAASSGASRPRTVWTAGRVVSLVAGSVLLFGAAGTLVAGGSLAWASQNYREGDFLMSPEVEIATDRYGITTESIRLEGAGLDWVVEEVVGDVRLEVTSTDPDVQVFIGIARTDDVEAYLHDVGYAELDSLGPTFGWFWRYRSTTTEHPGGAPAQPPAQADIWADSSSGSGPQSLTWRASEGEWTVVAMRADGGADLAVDVRVGAEVPRLAWIIAGVFVAGAALLTLGGLLVALSVRQAQRALPRDHEPVGR